MSNLANQQSDASENTPSPAHRSSTQPVLQWAPPPDRRSLRQANALAKSAQTLTVQQKRLVSLAIAKVPFDATEFHPIDVPITELGEFCRGNPYTEAERAADGLMRAVVHIQDPDTGVWLKHNWLHKARYMPASMHPEGIACITIELHEQLEHFLLELKRNFNSIPIEQILPMDSANAQHLFEILWHDTFAGKRSSYTYEINDLKVKMGFKGVRGGGKGAPKRKELYTTWRNFRICLGRAMEEINTHGDLKITDIVGIRHQSRAYTHVRFHVELVTPQAESEPGPKRDVRDPEHLALANEVEQAGYTHSGLKAIDEYGFDIVKETLKLAKEAEKAARGTRRPITNLGGLIASMLKQGIAERRQKREQGMTPAKAEELARHVIKVYGDALAEAAEEVWNAMTADERDDDIAMMRVVLPSYSLNLLDDAAWEGRAWESARNTYVVDTYPERLPQHLLEIDKFIEHSKMLEGLTVEESKMIQQKIDHLHNS